MGIRWKDAQMKETGLYMDPRGKEYRQIREWKSACHVQNHGFSVMSLRGSTDCFADVMGNKTGNVGLDEANVRQMGLYFLLYLILQSGGRGQ